MVESRDDQTLPKPFYAKALYKYDSNGYLVEIDDSSTLTPERRTMISYNKTGRWISHNEYNAENGMWVSRDTLKYDEHCWLKEEKYYNAARDTLGVKCIYKNDFEHNSSEVREYRPESTLTQPTPRLLSSNTTKRGTGLSA